SLSLKHSGVACKEIRKCRSRHKEEWRILSSLVSNHCPGYSLSPQALFQLTSRTPDTYAPPVLDNAITDSGIDIQPYLKILPMAAIYDILNRFSTKYRIKFITRLLQHLPERQKLPVHFLNKLVHMDELLRWRCRTATDRNIRKMGKSEAGTMQLLSTYLGTPALHSPSITSLMEEIDQLTREHPVLPNPHLLFTLVAKQREYIPVDNEIKAPLLALPQGNLNYWVHFNAEDREIRLSSERAERKIQDVQVLFPGHLLAQPNLLPERSVEWYFTASNACAVAKKGTETSELRFLDPDSAKILENAVQHRLLSCKSPGSLQLAAFYLSIHEMENVQEWSERDFLIRLPSQEDQELTDDVIQEAEAKTLASLLSKAGYREKESDLVLQELSTHPSSASRASVSVALGVWLRWVLQNPERCPPREFLETALELGGVPMYRLEEDAYLIELSQHKTNMTPEELPYRFATSPGSESKFEH
ncbi:MAG: hypothetical protein KDK78_07220, partial [Chlamydiia bacterium]|nr:hypothetical protein [Chlamydiia bacterium]